MQAYCAVVQCMLLNFAEFWHIWLPEQRQCVDTIVDVCGSIIIFVVLDHATLWWITRKCICGDHALTVYTFWSELRTFYFDLATVACDSGRLLCFGRVIFLWPPHGIGGHYIFILWFLLSTFFLSSFFLLSSFFFSPILSRRRLDVYHASIHCVALVRI